MAFARIGIETRKRGDWEPWGKWSTGQLSEAIHQVVRLRRATGFRVRAVWLTFDRRPVTREECEDELAAIRAG